jgi:hypothetical protein
MTTQQKSHLIQRKRDISKDYLAWREKCYTKLYEINPFSEDVGKLCCEDGIRIRRINGYSIINTWDKHPEKDYQLACHNNFYMKCNNTSGSIIFPTMQKVFNICDLPEMYGFENVSTFKEQRCLFLKVLCYFFTLIYFVLSIFTLPYIFTLALFIVGLLSLMVLEGRFPPDEYSNVPLELLYTLKKQGFVFEWQPCHKGKKVVIWYEERGNINIYCPKEELTTSEKELILFLFKQKEYIPHVYNHLYYKLIHSERTLIPLYTIDALGRNINSFGPIDSNIIKRSRIPFDIKNYGVSLEKALIQNKNGVYLCATKEESCIHVAKVRIDLKFESLPIDRNYSWVQELVIYGLIDNYILEKKQKEHARRVQAYLHKVAAGSKNQLRILASYKYILFGDNNYHNYLEENITQKWLQDYLRDNIPPVEDNYYEFLCDVLASSSSNEKVTLLEKLQQKELFWFHSKKRMHL